MKVKALKLITADKFITEVKRNKQVETESDENEEEEECVRGGEKETI